MYVAGSGIFNSGLRNEGGLKGLFIMLGNVKG